MATQKPKLRDVLEFLYWFPAGLCAGFWHECVQKPRICRMVKHRGRGADLHGAQLHFVSLPGVCLEGANLSKASILRADLHGADLRNADLSSASLHSTNLQGANLRGANLQRAGLIGTDLQGADLTDADLTHATLLRGSRFLLAEYRNALTPEQQAKFHDPAPNLAGADLTGATLLAADLLDADLTGAKLTGVRADVRTRWPEGFDPQQHGIEIPPLAAEWHLKRGEVVLGTLRNCRPDYRPPLPWLLGQFTPTSAFEEVQPVFDEAVRLRETDQREEYYKARGAIDKLGLQLESLEGEVLDPYSLYIKGEEAWFRY